MANISTKRKEAMARMLAAPTAKKTVVEAPIKECSHVLPGDVWCTPCAEGNLAYARKMHTKALTQSHNPMVHQAATQLLKKAVEEHALTPRGVTALKKSHLDAVQRNNKTVADRLYSQIQRLEHVSSTRSQEARINAKRQRAAENTAQLVETQHALPNTDSNGHITTADTSYVITHHARERMELRSITTETLEETFNNPAVFNRDRKSWHIQNEEITLIGTFVAEKNKKKFIIKTTYRNTDSVEEKEAELQFASL